VVVVQDDGWLPVLTITDLSRLCSVLRRTTFLFLFVRLETKVVVAVKAKFDEKVSLPLVVRSAGGAQACSF
jgi:hypothetical protein